MRSRILLLLTSLFMAEIAAGATITVRKDGTGDYAVIQQALDVAADGDTILIGPGEYTESSMVRLPGWAYDSEVFAHLRSDNLTLIGSGEETTIIGPAVYGGGAVQYSPAGIVYGLNRGSLRVSDLTVRHCYMGLYLTGTLYMDRCKITNNRFGLDWLPTGSGGWVKDSVFEVTEPIFDPIALDIGFGGTGSDILMERCQLSHPATVRGVQGMVIRDCDLTGLNLYSGAQTHMYDCRSSGSNYAVSQTLGSGTYCEIWDSQLSGTTAALVVGSSAPGGIYAVENSRLEGGEYGVLRSASGAGACTIHNCDFVKGAGPLVQCEVSAISVTHDLRNNYWGTTDDAEIRSWIVDHTDNPSIGATVLYAPFAGQSVPAETTTWGDLKALFR
jgi:hypothetical protein